MIGIFSDSYGDLAAFDAAYELLRGKGARRFFFTGGRFADLDEWILARQERARGGRAYSDADFLSDVSAWLDHREPGNSNTPVPGSEGAPASEDAASLKERFVRAPERDSLAYRDPSIPKKVVDMLGDHLCCVVHDKNDLSREDLLNASFFIHGKESEPKVVQIGPRFFVTPGKLTGAAEQTCGLIQALPDKSLKYSAFTLEGRAVLDSQTLSFERRNKISVK